MATTTQGLSDIKNELGQLEQNLNYRLADLELVRRSIPQLLYLDTADLRAATLGMYEYWKQPAHRIGRLFAEGRKKPVDRLLIQCLAARGMLGRFGLLLPHQAEYVGQLKNSFRMDLKDDDRFRFARQFTQAIADEGAFDQLIDLESLRDSKKIEQEEALIRNTATAPNYFKAVQCISGRNWQERLAVWIHYNLFRFDEQSEEDFEKLLEDELYNRLRRYLDEERPGLTTNNLIDALALTLLARQVALLKEALLKDPENGKQEQNASATKPTKQLRGAPYMYCPSSKYGNTIREVIKKAGAEEKFRYSVVIKQHDESEREVMVDVLRDETYFVFMASFREINDLPKAIKSFTPHKGFNDIEDVQRLRDRVAGILSQGQEVDIAKLQNIEGFGRPLPQLLKELREVSFLENVWRPFAMNDDVKDSIKRLRQDVDTVTNNKTSNAGLASSGERSIKPYEIEGAQEVLDAFGKLGDHFFRKGVDELRSKLEEGTDGFANQLVAIVADVQKKLTDNVTQWMQGMELWQKLAHAPSFLRKWLPVSAQGQKLIPMREFGLMSYGLPKSYQETITKVFIDLLSEDKDKVDAVRRRVVTAYFTIEKLTEDSPEQQEKLWKENLPEVSAVLNACELWEELRRLLDNVRERRRGEFPHFSYDVMYGEAIWELHKIQPCSDSESIMKDIATKIENQQSAVDNDEERVEIAIGLAFLYFRLWQLKTEVNAQKDEVAFDYIHRAMHNSRMAYDRASRNSAESVYIVNVCLYYMVEYAMAGYGTLSDTELKEVENYTQYLSSARQGNSSIWHYRYDDTLARYWWWKAKQIKISPELPDSEQVKQRKVWRELMTKAKELIDSAYEDCPFYSKVPDCWKKINDEYSVEDVLIPSGFTVTSGFTVV